jgi:CheY-like chemotaxis protein
MVNILVVEDDKHKSTEICNYLLAQGISKDSVHLTESIADTIRYLKVARPDRIVLDMSLPSHTTKLGEGSAIPLPNGGIEVLLELRYNGITDLPVLILTQYPQIEVNHRLWPLAQASEVIMSAFAMQNITVCEFESEDDKQEVKSWETYLRNFLDVK